VTTSAVGQDFWLDASTPLPTGATIKAFSVCYQMTDRFVNITQIRIMEQSATDPFTANVKLDVGVNLNSLVNGTCSNITTYDFTPVEAVFFRLRFKFDSVDSLVNLGGVSVIYSLPLPPATSAMIDIDTSANQNAESGASINADSRSSPAATTQMQQQSNNGQTQMNQDSSAVVTESDINNVSSIVCASFAVVATLISALL